MGMATVLVTGAKPVNLRMVLERLNHVFDANTNMVAVGITALAAKGRLVFTAIRWLQRLAKTTKRILANICRKRG